MSKTLLATGIRRHTLAGPLRWVKLASFGNVAGTPRNPLDAAHGVVVGVIASLAIWAVLLTIIALL